MSDNFPLKRYHKTFDHVSHFLFVPLPVFPFPFLWKLSTTFIITIKILFWIRFAEVVEIDPNDPKYITSSSSLQTRNVCMFVVSIPNVCAVYQYALYYYSQATQHVIIITSCCPLLSLHGHTTDTRCDTLRSCVWALCCKSFYPACLVFLYVISTLYFICFTSKRKRFCFHLWEFSPESTYVSWCFSHIKEIVALFYKKKMRKIIFTIYLFKLKPHLFLCKM